MVGSGNSSTNPYLTALVVATLLSIPCLLLFYIFDIYRKTHIIGDKKALWPGHFAGRQKEYCHIEAMGNLDKIPVDHGFTVSVLPIKLSKASAAWTRCVAILWE